MVIPRASARWTSRLVNQSTRTARATNRTRSWQRTQRRTYASGGDHGGHGSSQSGILSGDLPWYVNVSHYTECSDLLPASIAGQSTTVLALWQSLEIEILLTHLYRAIGASIVTVPSLWYLSQPQIERFQNSGKGHGGHGHEGGEHDEHGEKADGGDGGVEGEEGGEDEGKESGEEKGEDQAEEADGGREDSEEGVPAGGEKSDDSDSEGGNHITPETPSDKGKDGTPREVDSGGNVEGVQFKGAVAGGTKGNNEQGDTRKHIPDAKGANKKRIESDFAKPQGVAENAEQDPHNEDKV